MSETTTGRTDTSEIGSSVPAGLAAISARQTEATALAKVAKVCARAGADREAMGIVVNLDAPQSQIQNLHGALFLIARINRTATEATAFGD